MVVSKQLLVSKTSFANCNFVNVYAEGADWSLESFALKAGAVSPGVDAGVANESAPLPSVTRDCPELPSAPGNLNVRFAAGLLSGVVRETLLPHECTNFMLLILSPP